MKSLLVRSKSQTQKIATKLARQILKVDPLKRARILALSGDLGAGKTTFTQGFIKALGVKHHVTSPTFLIVRRYNIPNYEFSKTQNLKTKTYLNVYHFDLYRIHSIAEMAQLHFKKIINDPQNIVLIEWPERIGKSIPKSAQWIYFEHGRNIKERRIVIKN